MKTTLSRPTKRRFRPPAPLLVPVLGLFVSSPIGAQVVGPLQVEIVGDTVLDEGDRVGYTIQPWTPAAEIAPSYQWDFGDGRTVSREEETAVGHRFIQDGDYTVSASDGAGVATIQVTVRPVAPVITILSHDAEFRAPGDPVRFQAVARDAGADTLTYTWDFGDGSEQSDVDLTEVTHDFGRSGSFSVTLVVADEDGLEARRTISVTLGFSGQLAGDVSTPVEGVTGPATLMNALGLGPLFTGAAPMGSGLADLGAALGVCLMSGGFWDDTNKVHVNFQWTADPDSLWSGGTFPVQWDHPDGGLAPDQMLVNALVLEIGSSYEDTKGGAETGQIIDGGGLLDGLLSGLSGMDMGAPSGVVQGPGRNWTLHSEGGSVTITGVTPARISGHMSVELMGAWLSTTPSASGQVGAQTIEGAFAWELDEVARANLLRCGDQPFRVASHTPKVEAETVDYEVPGVSVTFTRPVSRESVRAETLELGYVTESGGFQRIKTRIVFDENQTRVHLIPEEALYDGIFHRVRIHAGEGGVKSIDEERLQEDYEWRFATRPELVLRADGRTS